jgi:Mu-like prophage major head subunit gpT
MGANTLSSRAIIGRFYATLVALAGKSWVDKLSMLFDSDQDSETYKWLGMVPAMREWVGGRDAKGFRENGITIVNKDFEATLEVLTKEIRRDKTGQVMVRINELARRTVSHWASLLSTLILSGTATACYDGQYFFDTDHSEGDSGTQDNDLSIDISALPAAVHGSTTLPSPEEMQQCILQAVAAILGFKDDQGEPFNEDASEFLVMVPTSLYLGRPDHAPERLRRNQPGRRQRFRHQGGRQPAPVQLDGQLRRIPHRRHGQTLHPPGRRPGFHRRRGRGLRTGVQREKAPLRRQRQPERRFRLLAGSLSGHHDLNPAR